jgi:MHS family proline/betaine transporter-like MFS transporter
LQILKNTVGKKMMTEAVAHAERRKNIVGGVVGNILEWYDFAVYGYFAPIIGTLFFPLSDPLASMIAAYGVFAAGYFMRPIGGVIFGYIGDKTGRKRALTISVLMMAIPTTAIAFLPTHARIGVYASILLIAIRLIQGASVGGELIGSISFVTEIAPKNRRGLYGSFTMFSAIAGVMLGSLAATLAHSLFTPVELHRWGWRLPFLAGLFIGIFGLWMRKGMAESPEFETLQSDEVTRENPVIEALKSMPLRILNVFGLILLLGGGFYLLFVWWPTYLTKIIHPAVAHGYLVNTIAMAGLMLFIPLGGWVSDITGYKKTLIGANALIILATFPLFFLTDYGTFSGALTAQVIFALFMGGILGPMPALMMEMFPTETRFSGIAIGYNGAQAVFGGTAPMICTWLVDKTGSVIAPAYYLIFLAAVTLVATITARTNQ